MRIRIRIYSVLKNHPNTNTNSIRFENVCRIRIRISLFGLNYSNTIRIPNYSLTSDWLYVILCSLGLQAGFWPKKTELISDSADWERRGKCDMFSRFMLSMQTRISENQTKRHWWNGDLKKGIKYLKSGKVITSCFVAFRKLKSMIFQCQRGKKG